MNEINSRTWINEGAVDRGRSWSRNRSRYIKQMRKKQGIQFMQWNRQNSHCEISQWSCHCELWGGGFSEGGTTVIAEDINGREVVEADIEDIVSVLEHSLVWPFLMAFWRGEQSWIVGSGSPQYMQSLWAVRYSHFSWDIGPHRWDRYGVEHKVEVWEADVLCCAKYLEWEEEKLGMDGYY